MAFIVDGLDNDSYQMRDGDGPAACLDWDGNFDLTIKAGKRNENTAKSGNHTATFTLIVQDNDFTGAKGSVIYHSFPIEGEVSTGANKGQRNIKALADMCISAGRDDLAALVKAPRCDVDRVISDLVGDGKSVHLYARVAQRLNDQKGIMESKPAFFITKTRYAETKASGANFRTKPATATKKAPPGAPAGAANGTAGAAMATDQLASEV